jgi:diaminopimelate epimerase
MTGEPPTIRYEYWSGAGNTFVLIDAAALPAWLTPAAFAPRACHPGRVAPAGTDGLLVVTGEQTGLWNRDGSSADFCGNGARCIAARRLRESGESEVHFRFGPFAVTGQRDGTCYAVTVPPPQLHERQPLPGELGSALAPFAADLLRLAWLEAGVPHLCLLLRGAPRAGCERGAARLRRHPFFGPGGTNVDLIWGPREGHGDLPVQLRTYERGVEGFTAACGSGAVAAAGFLLAGGQSTTLRMVVASGEALSVERNGPVWTLSGPAILLAEGALGLETG